MWLDIGLVIGILAGALLTGYAWTMNLYTPQPVGPIPFFGGAGLFVICVVWLIAKHIAWR